MIQLQRSTSAGILIAFIVAGGIASLQLFRNPLGDAIEGSVSTSSPLPEANTLVFAGIAGSAPRFIDSGPDKGTGWMDVQTQEIRKGLRLDGYQVKDEWLTPARIEHEIKARSPICTYPIKWSHPETLFGTKVDRVYSLSIDFAEEENQNIIFKKSKLSLFKKYSDAQGSILLEKLFKDDSLKTLLIRDVDYGKFSTLLTEIDEHKEQSIKKEFARHIELRVIKDSRQLIEMLNADRFDYIFSNSIEDADFIKTGISRENFAQLPYSSKTSIQGLADPNLERISIVCSLHPTALAALPVINKWVKLYRGVFWKQRKSDYRRQFERQRQGGHLPTLTSFYLAGRFSSQLEDGTADRWYGLQQKQIQGLQLLPQAERFQLKHETEIKPQLPPLWYSLPDGPDSLVILSRAQFYRRRIEDANFFEKSLFTSNPNHGWNQILLQLSPRTESALREFEKARRWKEGTSFASLPVLAEGARKARSVRRLTLMASGLRTEDSALITPLFEQTPVEEITLIDANPDVTKAALLSLLNNKLRDLNALDLTNSSLSNPEARSALLAILKSSPRLSALTLDSSQLDEASWITLLSGESRLREKLHHLSASHLGAAWTPKTCALFGKSVWKKLETLKITGSALNLAMANAILPGIPPHLKSLHMKSHHYPDFRPSLAAALPKLKHLHLERTNLIVKQGRIIQFPNSLSSLSLNQSEFRGDQLRLPETLDSLDISDPWFPNRAVESAIRKLGPLVKILNFRKVGLSHTELQALVQNDKIKRIERLNLSWNQLDDRAIQTLSQARFQVDCLDLSNNRIRNEGAALIAKRFLPTLRCLSLSENPIAEEGTRALAQALPQGLEILKLSGLISLDTQALAESLPPSLKRLDLSGNLLSQGEVKHLVKSLPPDLSDLDVSSTGLSQEGLVFLVSHLPPGITHLFLPEIGLQPNAATELFAHLPRNLTDLGLGSINLDVKSAEAFSQRIPKGLREFVTKEIKWKGTEKEVELAQTAFFSSLPPSLLWLGLYQTKAGEAGSRALSLHWPPNMRSFWTTGVDFGDEGMKILAETLPTTLEVLKLAGSKFTDQGIQTLATLPLPNVITLNLSLNSISGKGLTALCSKPRVFQLLNLTATGLRAQDLSELNQNCLRLLYTALIGNNPIGNKGFITLVRRVSPYFQFINAPSIGITYEGFEKVINAFPPYLGGVELNGNSIGPLGYQMLEMEAAERIQNGRPFFTAR